ncbi:MAG: T9SS type A sorting domain-containing protein [Chitinophagaceae bacterium]
MNYVRFIINALSKVMVTISPFGVFGQSVHIMPGAKMVMNGTVRLVLNNASFVNDGIFAEDNSTVVFTGNSPVAVIGGTSNISFGNLSIQKSSGNVLMNKDITMTGTINMVTGNLQLNNRKILLGNSGSISGESNSSYITGTTGGSVNVTRTFTVNTALNPGNIGAELRIDGTTGTKVGAISIQRTHIPESLSNGGLGIPRVYTITNSTGLPISNARLRFFYVDPELSGNSEANIEIWKRSGAGSFFVPIGKDGNDATQNWVFKSGIADVSSFTLSSQSEVSVMRTGNNQLNATGEEPIGNSKLASAYPNPAKDKFTVNVYSEESKKMSIELYDVTGHLLQTKEVKCVRGTNIIQWNISNYASGVYYLSFKNHSVKNIKIIKE